MGSWCLNLFAGVSVLLALTGVEGMNFGALSPCSENDDCDTHNHYLYKDGSKSRSARKYIIMSSKECKDIDECKKNCKPEVYSEYKSGSFCCIHVVENVKFYFFSGIVFINHPEIYEDISELTRPPSPVTQSSSVNILSNVNDNERKKDIPITNSKPLPHVGSSCAQMNMAFRILDEASSNQTTTVSLNNMTESFGTVLEQIHTWSTFIKEVTSTLATIMLESVQSNMLAAFLKPSVNESQTIQTEHLDIESKVIKEECTEGNISINLKAKGDEMRIGCSTIEESGSSETSKVAFFSYECMESALDKSFFQDFQAPLTNSKRKLKMNSRIISSILSGENKDNFSGPVIYTLENIQPKQKFESPICISWDTDVQGGRWTSSGCVILSASKTHTVCSCQLLVNLAIIMASEELTMEYSLYVISQLGLTISLVCLALAIATFLLCHSICNRNMDLHLHLCVCLFLAKILFLTSADKTSNQLGCAIIAGLLHYLFLACFFWMLVEAAMLFLMVRNLKVVNYFSSRNIKMLHLCVLGYGLPVLVVVVSASVQPQGYGMHNRCWLNTETGFIWSFLGPVCIIIMVNSILLTWNLRILRQKLSSVNAEVSTFKDTRLLTFKAFAQLFILGCSWVLGIFQIGAMASFMAHLFTIINSLQGAFIFLIHCLLNPQVQEEYRRWFTGKIKPSSQSQASGVLLSSLPSTSKMG
ncbi:adhesion G protein-coupled receptor E1-like [Choloepus didactylus]|uniref:adhesion G protein-coupled receptor E1-like n=1 Tax=Choloepus didactylus TaxID=27675 RepID=UPI0018A0C412|nr:adhesion G protein-coupled receptor E1-like [Choloepus didactylus]